MGTPRAPLHLASSPQHGHSEAHPCSVGSPERGRPVVSSLGCHKGHLWAHSSRAFDLRGGRLAWRGGTPAPVVSGGQPRASVGAPRAHPGRHQGDTPQASRSCPRHPQLLVSAWRSLLVLVILGHAGGPHCGFHCVFLSSGDAEHLHACMFAPCVSRLAKHLFTSFAHLRNWVICFPTCEFSRGLDLSPAALLLVAAKGPPVPGGVTRSSPRGLCPEGPVRLTDCLHSGSLSSHLLPFCLALGRPCP